MDALLVLRPGLQTTVQDGGRRGYGRYGVPPSGALDPISLRLGNLLLDNPPDAAALELSLVGPDLEALAPLALAYVGADMGLRVGERPTAPGATFWVAEGEVLRFGAARTGARAYLCVPGGVDVPPELGSRSTAVTAGLGGYEGRPLLGSDVVRAAGSDAPLEELAGRRLKPAFRPAWTARATLRVLDGPQAAAMPEALAELLRSEWRVSPRADRVGARLEGPSLPVGAEGWPTEGVPPGAVQVPPDGAPIILLADRQVTGGYPKPAVVADVDLPLAGQLRPGDRVSFERISEEEALRLLRERAALLAGGVWERAGGGEPTTLRELVELLEGSRAEELHLRVPGGSVRWRRRGTRL